jgi:hypothetical protein
VKNCPTGDLARCAQEVSFYTPEEQYACRLPDTIDEQVGQVGRAITELPGCNPITSGPGRAEVLDCPNNHKQTVPPLPNYVDFTIPKRWLYVGCATDRPWDRTLAVRRHTSDTITVTLCIDISAAEGYPYAGLENGNECWCVKMPTEDHLPKDDFFW